MNIDAESTSSLVVIPARFASSRYPGKPLAVVCGMSMLERVWRIARSCRHVSRVVIATDSTEIEDHARSFGAEVLLTSEKCRTGTDRVAEAAGALSERYDIIFSFQGDAVLTPPWVVEAVLEAMVNDPRVQIATPAVLLTGDARTAYIAEKQAGSTSGTCVVFDSAGDALYFSKALIPFGRDEKKAQLYRHIGLYGYRRETLFRFAALEPGQLEQAEQLEQLRALEHRIPIRVVTVDLEGRTHGSIDRPEDLAVIEEIIRQEGELPGIVS